MVFEVLMMRTCGSNAANAVRDRKIASHFRGQSDSRVGCVPTTTRLSFTRQEVSADNVFSGTVLLMHCRIAEVEKELNLNMHADVEGDDLLRQFRSGPAQRHNGAHAQLLKRKQARAS